MKHGRVKGGGDASWTRFMLWQPSLVDFFSGWKHNYDYCIPYHTLYRITFGILLLLHLKTTNPQTRQLTLTVPTDHYPT